MLLTHSSIDTLSVQLMVSVTFSRITDSACFCCGVRAVMSCLTNSSKSKNMQHHQQDDSEQRWRQSARTAGVIDGVVVVVVVVVALSDLECDLSR